MQQLAELLEFPDAAVFGTANAAYAVCAPLLQAFEGALLTYFPTQVHQAVAWTMDTRDATHSVRLPMMNPVPVAFAIFCYFSVLIALYFIGQAVGK